MNKHAPIVQAWPPDYLGVYAWRQQQLLAMQENPVLLHGALEYYGQVSPERCIEFIEHWVDTYDPRNVDIDMEAVLSGKVSEADEKSVRVPFILFDRQKQFVHFFFDCLTKRTSGLLEKSRDIGATWLCGAISVYLWRFLKGASIGWGANKADLLDKLGVLDTIFEKIRVIIRLLPPAFWPVGFDAVEHLMYMRVLNPETGTNITGEAGLQIGRGGRKTVYFKDESAHYEHPEAIEAALLANTDTQMDLSSVSLPNTLFHRKREAGRVWAKTGDALRGITNVFIFDWRDRPDRDMEWYETLRSKAELEGTQHVFAREVERNYFAAATGIIIKAEWIEAAVDAHLQIPGMDEGGWCAALDVADEGLDRNALAKRKGVVLRYLNDWGEGDTGYTARFAAAECVPHRHIDIWYDCIGVGAGVKAESNRLASDPQKPLPPTVRFRPWNAAEPPLFADKRMLTKGNGLPDKDSPLTKDFFENIKAQGWWQLARRFELTWRVLVKKEYRVGNPEEAATGDKVVGIGQLISLDRAALGVRLPQLKKELTQVTKTESKRLKMVIVKTPEGTRSPNMGDATMMCYWPAVRSTYDSNMKWVR